MAKLVLIGDELTVLGFRFAGIPGRVPSDDVKAADLFRQAVDAADVGIVIITEPIARTISAEIDAVTATRDFPLVVEIPDGAGPIPDRKSPTDVVREAIGMSI